MQIEAIGRQRLSIPSQGDRHRRQSADAKYDRGDLRVCADANGPHNAFATGERVGAKASQGQSPSDSGT